MNNFNFLLERLANIHDEKDRDDEKIKSLIQLGKNIDESFWDNFLMLLNKTDAFSVLFEMPEEKISKIYRKIKNFLVDHKEEIFTKKNKTRKLL